MQPLKLVALDKEDLEVVSAHLQDAVLRVGDLVWRPRQKRFVAILNRFDWQKANAGNGSGQAGRAGQPFERRRAALRLERVMSAKLHNINVGQPDHVLSLLALLFEEGNSPGGHVTLVFSGGAAIRLEVECVEAELRDLGSTWGTTRKPEHRDDGEPTGS